MERIKKEILQWLDREGRTKKYLSEKFKKSTRTIDNWFRSDREFPKEHIPKIMELMARDRENSQAIVIRLTAEQIEKIKATPIGKSVLVKIVIDDAFNS